MKNLVLLTERHRNCPFGQGKDGESPSPLAVDLAYLEARDGQGSLCLVLRSNGTLEAFLDRDDDFNSSERVWQVDLNSVMDQEREDAIKPQVSDGWFSVQVLSSRSGSSIEQQQQQFACCLDRTTGAIVMVSCLNGEPSLELVGEFENGILAASWSPNGQVLALAVNQQHEDDENQYHTMVLTMTNHFEVLSEALLHPNPSPTSDNPSGSSSTVLISWKPDGKYFAVLSENTAETLEQPTSVILRIYNCNDLSTHALGRTEDGSGKLLTNLQINAMAWAGTSCSLLLAVVQRTGSKTKICFVETNGLAHGGFALRNSHSTVHQMAWWNSESHSLLAIHITTNTNEEKIQLWHRSNYHWYLKQEFQFVPKTTPLVSCLRWNSSSSLETTGTAMSKLRHLTVLLKSGARKLYQFWWEECIAPRESTALVVDGCRILCTPLARALVPPPMAAATVELPAPIRHIALAPPAREENFACSVIAVVHLADDTVVVLGGQAEEMGTTEKMIPNYCPPKVLATISSAELHQALNGDLKASFEPFYLFHSLLVTSIGYPERPSTQIDCVAVEVHAENPGGETILEFSLSYSQSDRETDVPSSTAVMSIDCISRMPLEHGLVLTMTNWHDEDDNVHSLLPTGRQSGLVELQDGQLLEYSGGRIHQGTMEPLLEPCPRIIGLRRKIDTDNMDYRVIGMSWRKRFYCNEVLLVDCITSFDMSDRFLCCATGGASHCQLKFIAKSQLWLLDPIGGSSEDHALVIAADYEPRLSERGSRIVTLLTNKPVAVLQLPRGNLEGVCPRALVLPHILRQLRHNGNYRSALELMRQHKVDLNLLVDWNPAEFLSSGAAKLLSQVNDVDHLNLFISSLRNENVAQTRHLLPFWLLNEFHLSSTSTNHFDFTTKVNVVCRKLRSLMVDEAQVGDAMLLPVLSTFAKQEPPQLEEALSLIKSKALQQQTGIPSSVNKNKSPLFSERAQSAIQYLAFLANYEILFDTALAMYDFDLARAVARNSQMDPKIYLPLIQRCRELPTFYSRYEVDIRLNRYPEALRNLVESYNQNEVDPCGLGIANSFEDLLTLIKNHRLHRRGLELLQEEKQKRDILLDLGEHLLREGAFNNALTVFMTIPNPIPVDSIMKAARACQDWRAYFYYAALVADDDSNSASLASGHAESRYANLARDLTQQMVASAATIGQQRKREILSDAARIMLDYASDPAEAVDLLLQAEFWSEAWRIGMLHGEPSLVKKCIETAATQAYTTIDDLTERASTFVMSMARYVEVLNIRKEAYAMGEELPSSSVDVQSPDDSASLFSTASHTSHLTGLSRSSAATSASYSTVISLSSKASGFSISGADQESRHKSKYNQIGATSAGKKEKKKKGKGRTKEIPGSERELERLVETLTSLCLDSAYTTAVADCIIFLCRTGEFPLATNLYIKFQDSAKKIFDCQNDRLVKEQEARCEKQERMRREGTRDDLMIVQHPLESTVDGLKCEELPISVHQLFKCLF